MNGIKPEDARLKKLRIETLLAYLRASGWNLLEHPNERAWFLSGPPDDEGQPVKLILPRRQDYQDASLRLADAVNLLADLQGHSPDEVLRELEDFDPQPQETGGKKAEGRHWQDRLAPLAATTSLAVCVAGVFQRGGYLYVMIGITMFLIALNSLSLTKTVGKLK